METKHTPGPWKVQPTELYEGGMGIAIVGADGEVVASNQTYYPKALDPKNASLLAASPDMYAMLKTLEEFLSQIDDVSAILLAVATNAVLAKAEGKE